MTLPYTHDISAALETSIQEQGASQATLDAAMQRIPAIAQNLKERSDKGELSFLAEPFKREDFAVIERIAKKVQDQFSHLVVLGTGGSSLGGLTLCSLKQPRYMPSGLNVHFVDNTDPETMEQLFNQLPLSNTFFMMVSKSGNTVETMVQSLLIIEQLEAQSLPVKEHCLAITMPGERGLRQLAEAYELETLEHDAELGGRFSVLSWVGLLPAAAAGLNVEQLREGAKAVMQQCWDTPLESSAAQGAALQYALMEKGKSITVLMPYVDRLQNLGRWYQQLWGESIGKEGRGTTAVAALGAVDQHSQLQLYAEGPKDKLITFLTLDNAGKGGVVKPALAAKAGMDYLGNHSIGDVINAQQVATMQSLTGYKAALRHMRMQDDSEFTIGALLQHFMLETALTAGLMEIDAFNQPGVEESKNLAREALS